MMWFFIKVTQKLFFRFFLGETYWLRFWALLQCSDDGKEWILDAYKLLESRVMEFFASHRWSFIYRLYFSFEHVINFNYGCATVISLTDDSSFYKKAEAENFPLSKKKLSDLNNYFVFLFAPWIVSTYPWIQLIYNWCTQVGQLFSLPSAFLTIDRL